MKAPDFDVLRYDENLQTWLFRNIYELFQECIGRWCPHGDETNRDKYFIKLEWKSNT